MNRRNFLKAMVAAGAAPAFIPITNLMRPVVHKVVHRRAGAAFGLEILEPGEVIRGVDRTVWEFWRNEVVAMPVSSSLFTADELLRMGQLALTHYLEEPSIVLVQQPRLFKPVA